MLGNERSKRAKVVGKGNSFLVPLLVRVWEGGYTLLISGWGRKRLKNFLSPNGICK